MLWHWVINPAKARQEILIKKHPGSFARALRGLKCICEALLIFPPCVKYIHKSANFLYYIASLINNCDMTIETFSCAFLKLQLSI